MSERLSRSIHQSSGVERGCEPNSTAFLPRKADLTTSVIRSQNLDEESIWTKCKSIACLRPSGQQKLYGRADLQSSDVEEIGLRLDRDREDHANICGWSDEKPKRMLEATKLAMKSRFISHPNGVWENVPA